MPRAADDHRWVRALVALGLLFLAGLGGSWLLPLRQPGPAPSQPLRRQ